MIPCDLFQDKFPSNFGTVAGVLHSLSFHQHVNCRKAVTKDLVSFTGEHLLGGRIIWGIAGGADGKFISVSGEIKLFFNGLIILSVLTSTIKLKREVNV